VHEETKLAPLPTGSLGIAQSTKWLQVYQDIGEGRSVDQRHVDVVQGNKKVRVYCSLSDTSNLMVTDSNGRVDGKAKQATPRLTNIGSREGIATVAHLLHKSLSFCNQL
jgi:hypothetical protein